MSVAQETALYAGQRLTRAEFMRRWEARPDIKFAELINGVVFMPSPQTRDHGGAVSDVDTWLSIYRAHTPGTDSGTQSTWLMLRSAPQPDAYLWILPEYGGQSGIEGKYHTGAPELAAEICYSSAAYDLGVKKLLYQKARVLEYVAFLMEEREVRWHRLTKRGYELSLPRTKGIYRSEIFPGLWLNEPALWKHDLASVLQTLHRGLKSAEHAAFVKALAARRI